MALWDSEKTHCSSPSFVSNGNWRGRYATYIEHRKYRNIVYLKNGFVPLYHFPCAVGKSHVVGKVIMGVQWDHDIVHFLPRWHKTIRLLYCSIFFHHRPPGLIISQIHCLLEQKNTQEIHRDIGCFGIFWWISFQCNGNAARICSYRLIYPLQTKQRNQHASKQEN